ncbi:hypothetical protein Lfu02_67380 [Longispora fulva]|uniref:Uncharacterized protein n=1 Tax=Longispora fulva TaxID=619741 RepID=A0A8J7GDG0_9ACTN|nr:hypothetical protein [Longispora fulva]MBG6138528.1 hypothetical protein [Longispora fulva]GIG62366.1 hypothetical protein Lfu02_67380 [Longispora fulva]
MTESHRLTDERLAWLAMRDYCDEKSRRTGIMGFLSRIQTPGANNERRSAKMMDYGLAVDDVARDLTPAERAELRRTGMLPGWFVESVEARYAEIVRGRR